MIISRKYFSTSWIYLQVNSLVAAIITGLVIGCFRLVFSSLSWPSFWGILLFSSFHAFAMAYSISFYTEVLNKRIPVKWIKVPILLFLGILGTFIATELSYWILALSAHQSYRPFLHNNQVLVNFSICIIASAVVLLYESQRITYKNHFQRKEIEILRLKQLKMKEELEALQSKINPHFLYNSLNTIAALVYDQAALAEELTLKLSKLFRYSINYTENNFSTVCEEIEMLNVFMDIEKIRLGNRLTFTVSASPETLNLPIPRFLLQPLVENALKHGLCEHAENGRIEIKISRENRNLIICIYDNGQDFPQQVSSGQGFQNTYEKLELLCRKQYEFKLINKPKKHVLLIVPIEIYIPDADLLELLN